MSEIKQTNFRINSESADKFRAFCEEQNLNQAQGFDHLIQVLELDRAKAVTPDRAVEIEEFERHAKALLSAYMYSLEIAGSTEERVLEQYRSKLDSKDATILDLQAKTEETKAKLAGMEAEVREAVESQKKAEDRLLVARERMESAEKTASDKAAIAEMLSGKLADAEEKLKDYPALKQAVESLNKALREKDQMIAEALLSAEKTLAALEKEKNKEVQSLRDKIDALKDEKAELKDELAALKAQIAELKAATIPHREDGKE